MKKSIIASSAIFILIMTMSGCHRDIYGCTDPAAANYARNANVDNGSCRYNGNVMFWFDRNNGVGTVTINGQSANINGFVTGGVPNCGNNVSANFTLQEGSYIYSASATNGLTWNDTATVFANNCQLYQLH